MEKIFTKKLTETKMIKKSILKAKIFEVKTNKRLTSRAFNLFEKKHLDLSKIFSSQVNKTPRPNFTSENFSVFGKQQIELESFLFELFRRNCQNEEETSQTEL